MAKQGLRAHSRRFRGDRLLPVARALLALLAVFSAGAAAASDSAARPAAVAVAPVPIVVPGDRAPHFAALLAQFESLQDRVMQTGQVAGLGVVVVKDGKVVSKRGLGVADVATRAPVGTDTVFRLASLSKAFAATLAAMLVDEGYLRWDDTVQTLIPAFELKNTRESARVTVEDLLSHRLGLPYNALDPLLERDEPYPLLVYKLRELPMSCGVGDCYAYQNVAFSLIGDLTFATTGDFFSYQVERRLFHPLGMTTATYGRDAFESNPDHALPHVKRNRRWVAVRPKESYYRLPPAAGVNASVSDLGEWLLAQLGHRPDVLRPELLAELHRPRVSTPGERQSSPWRRERLDDAQYALGWRIYTYAGHRLVYHAGAVQGFRAMLALLPDHDLGVALVWNCESGIPAGLLPTFLDGYLGLPPRDWLELHRVPRQPMLAGG